MKKKILFIMFLAIALFFGFAFTNMPAKAADTIEPRAKKIETASLVISSSAKYNSSLDSYVINVGIFKVLVNQSMNTSYTSGKGILAIKNQAKWTIIPDAGITIESFYIGSKSDDMRPRAFKNLENIKSYSKVSKGTTYKVGWEFIPTNGTQKIFIQETIMSVKLLLLIINVILVEIGSAMVQNIGKNVIVGKSLVKLRILELIYGKQIQQIIGMNVLNVDI